MDRPKQQAVVASTRDRRQHARYTLQVPMELYQEESDVPMRLETTDLSLGGCYIQTMMPLTVGTRLHATLWLNGNSVVVRGLVVTRHPQFGNGIMFVEFENDGEARLRKYLTSIRC